MSMDDWAESQIEEMRTVKEGSWNSFWKVKDKGCWISLLK
jgi:hypothetical protein